MSEPIDPQLLAMIRCPRTKSVLTFATPEEVDRINAMIDAREALNVIGQVVEEKLDQGLINEDRTLMLPVRGGIVILIADQAIDLA